MGRGGRAYVVALMTVYVAGLAVLVTSPWGWELNRLTVRLYAHFRTDVPIAPGWVRPEHYGVLLNILLFVPLGALLRAAVRRPWWWVVLVALACSSVIELVQWRWLEREGSWSDVVANTAGALVGVVLLSRSQPVRARRARRSGHEHHF